MGKLTRERNSFRSKAEGLNAELDALRKGLAECATSLEGEMLQKYGGQKPEDMHPVTRRDYDRDMAELAGYRAAMGKGERP
jgi:prefoldin subunit 5